MNSKLEVLNLYKQLLRKAQYFPSMNKAGIVQSIKDDFRSYREESNSKRLTEQFEMAKGGMKRLDEYIESFVDVKSVPLHHRKYITVSSNNTQWKFKMT
jgi:hypothetical protein